MSTVEERAQFGRLGEVNIKLASNGDESVEDFLLIVLRTTRLLDDLIDKDFAVDDSQVQQVFFDLLFSLQFNLFYRKHQYLLMGALLTYFNDWLDSLLLEKDRDPDIRLVGRVMSFNIDGVIPIVAYITGGFSKMREVSVSVRDNFRHFNWRE